MVYLTYMPCLPRQGNFRIAHGQWHMTHLGKPFLHLFLSDSWFHLCCHKHTLYTTLCLTLFSRLGPLSVAIYPIWQSCFHNRTAQTETQTKHRYAMRLCREWCLMNAWCVVLLQLRDAVRLCHEQCLMTACCQFKHLPDVQYIGQKELQYSDIKAVRKIVPAKMRTLNSSQRQWIITDYFAK